VKYTNFLAKGSSAGVLISEGYGAVSVSIEKLRQYMIIFCLLQILLHNRISTQPWIAAFKLTQAFDTWERVTDPMLFDIVEPRWVHRLLFCLDKANIFIDILGRQPSAVTDIGLQLSETIRDLKIDQQLAPTREAISSALSTGSTKLLKAVDGIKGRWPAQRSSSSLPFGPNSSTSTGNATPVTEASKNEIESEGASAYGHSRKPCTSTAVSKN